MHRLRVPSIINYRKYIAGMQKNSSHREVECAPDTAEAAMASGEDEPISIALAREPSMLDTVYAEWKVPEIDRACGRFRQPTTNPGVRSTNASNTLLDSGQNLREAC